MSNWKQILGLTIMAGLLASPAFSQKTKVEKEEKVVKEVIIKKDGKEEKMVIIVDGDNVTVNGKPVDASDNEHVIIRKKGMTIAGDGKRARIAQAPGQTDMARAFKFKHDAMESHGFLGVTSEKADGGVKIAEVSKESPAEKAGLQKGDILSKVGETKIETHQDLVDAISSKKPNDKVDITYKRNGKDVKTTATLGENKMNTFQFFNDEEFLDNFPSIPRAPRAEGFNFMWNQKPKIGLQIQDLEEGKGVKVKDVDEESPALKAGLKEGDIITQVNGKEVAGVDDIKKEIKDLKDGDSVKFTFKRDGKTQSAEVKIPKKLKTADL